MAAFGLYGSEFRASRDLAEPYVMLGFNVFGADSLGRAKFLATSMQHAFVNLLSGRPSLLQPPADGYFEVIWSQDRAILNKVLSCASIGTQEMMRADLHNFIML